jgi:PAS domain S-box-containing protein
MDSKTMRPHLSRLQPILFDALPGLIWTASPDGKRNYFNQSYLAFTGRRIEQVVGDGWLEDIHPEDRDRVHPLYLAAFESRQPLELEYRLRHFSGEYRWILDRSRPWTVPDEKLAGYIGEGYDLTGRKNF